MCGREGEQEWRREIKKRGEAMEEEEERKYVGSELGTVAAFQ